MTVLHTRETTQLAQQAADWVVRLDADPTNACRVELVDWLRLSPRHMEEFLLAQATYRAFHELGAREPLDMETVVSEIGNVVPIREAGTGVSGHRVNRRWRMLATAATLAVVSLAGGAWFHASTSGTETYRTATGEQRAIRLADGSLLSLNTQSTVRVSFSGHARTVRLLRGEALFDVAQEVGRPFVIHTPTAGIQVLGTQFNVYERAEGARVSVLEGRVKVWPGNNPAAPQNLSAGEEAQVSAGVIARQSADVSKAIAWRDRRLVFHGTPLAQVIREFNRYSERSIHLDDASLAQRRISGVFHADDPDTILKFLRAEPGVRIEDGAREIRVHRR